MFTRYFTIILFYICLLGIILFYYYTILLGFFFPTCAGDPDEWEKVIRVNMLSPMRLMRRLTPAMVEKGEGVVINIDSSAGLSPKPGNAVYSSSK